MILPHSYTTLMILMILSLVCWGSWANFFKLSGKWRFELFYFDFAIGLVLIALICAFTFGSLGFDGFGFLDDVMNAGKRQWLYGFTASMIFNFGNMLLMAAVSVTGMAVAFPLGYAVAIIVGSLMAFVGHPVGSGALLLVGCLLLLVSVATNGLAYNSRSVALHEAAARAGSAKSTHRPSPVKGIVLGLGGGLLLGCFAPLLIKAQDVDLGMGPYGLTAFFALGVAITTFVFNVFFMNLPVEGEPLEIFDFFKAPVRKHILGILGGMVWGGGAVASFALNTPKNEIHPDQPLATMLNYAAPLLAALCGLLIWKEYKGGDGRSKAFAVLSLLIFAGGAAAVAIAPLYGHKP